MDNATLSDELNVLARDINTKLNELRVRLNTPKAEERNRDFKNPMSWVTSFEEICMIAGAESKEVVNPKVYTSDEIAYRQIKLIQQVITQVHKFNYSDKTEKKWFPIFEVKEGSGFGFSGTGYAGCGTTTDVAARLCFRTENEATWAGKTFTKIYEKFIIP